MYQRCSRSYIYYIKKIVLFIIGIILFLLQSFIYYIILFKLDNIPGASIIISLISLIVVTYIYNSNNNSSYKLTWTIFCLLFNVLGVFCYLLFGNGASLPKRINKKISSYLDNKMISNDVLESIKDEDLIGYKHARLLNSNTNGYCLYRNSGNEFYNDGLKIYNSMIDCIKSARKYIFLEYFIINEGEIFNELFSLLEVKANEGVIIKIIYDAIGSSRLSKKLIKKINSINNICMVSYNPFGLNLNLRFNYRDHRKLLVVDGLYAYTGGINLSDEYIHKIKRFGYWRDNGSLIEGSCCYSYILLFLQNWYTSTREMLVIEDYKPVYNDTYDDGYIFGFGDGPNNKNSVCYDMMLSLINNATKSIYISTPYFIIDSNFISALCSAIKSGVDVKLLIPGIPDKKLIYNVTLAHLRDILLIGGEVYILNKGFNHAKNVVVDGKYAFVGTVNIDYRSMFLHFECGNLFLNTKSVIDVENDFINTIKECSLISIDDWENRNILQKFMAFILTILGPLL